MSDFIPNKEKRSKIRQEILKIRRTISEAEAFKSGQKVVEILKTHPFFENRKMVGSYLSLFGEMSTKPINDYLLENHDLALPFMNVQQKGLMDFYSYKKGDELIENRFHILEPVNNPENLIIPDRFDALIVPLVAFDKAGNRLGMGGGYYDRMLKKLPYQCLLIGVAYDFQLIEQVPIEQWDMPLHEVITPSEHYIF